MAYKGILNFNEAKGDGWKWHKLDHIQIICITMQTEINSISYRTRALTDSDQALKAK